MEATDPGHGMQNGVLPESPRLRLILLIILAIMAVVSSAVGIKEAVTDRTVIGGRGRNGGVDFQWSGAHILAQGQDPWKTYINGDPQRQIILGQQPNYLAEFYLLLGPLGRMS